MTSQKLINPVNKTILRKNPILGEIVKETTFTQEPNKSSDQLKDKLIKASIAKRQAKLAESLGRDPNLQLIKNLFDNAKAVAAEIQDYSLAGNLRDIAGQSATRHYLGKATYDLDSSGKLCYLSPLHDENKSTCSRRPNDDHTFDNVFKEIYNAIRNNSGNRKLQEALIYGIEEAIKQSQSGSSNYTKRPQLSEDGCLTFAELK